MFKIFVVSSIVLNFALFSVAQIENSGLEDQCHKGDANSCFELAHRFRTGVGAEQNMRLAFQFYSMSCDQNNASGCSGLGYLYSVGRGVTKDLQASLESFLKACELSEISGCAGAGNILIGGVLDNRDRQKGIKLLRRACLQDYDWACNRLREYEIPLKPGRKYR